MMRNKQNEIQDLVKYLNSLQHDKEEAAKFKKMWAKVCEKENAGKSFKNPFFSPDIWNF